VCGATHKRLNWEFLLPKEEQILTLTNKLQGCLLFPKKKGHVFTDENKKVFRNMVKEISRIYTITQLSWPVFQVQHGIGYQGDATLSKDYNRSEFYEDKDNDNNKMVFLEEPTVKQPEKKNIC